MYRAHGGAVRGFVRRRGGGEATDDLVADVFVAVWRRLPEAPSSDELSWLLGIARGVLANQRRGQQRQTALRARLWVHAERVPPSTAPLEAVESQVAAALAALSPADQELLLLVAWDGLDRRQAARVVGVSPGTFAVRLHRARRRFARALAAADLTRATSRRAIAGDGGRL